MMILSSLKLYVFLQGKILSSLFEGLILAQGKRWRRALGMQVERALRFGG